VTTLDVRGPSTASGVDAAVAAARRSQPEWSRTPAARRAAAVHAAAAAVRRHAGELAKLQEAETGRPRDEALGGIAAGADTLDQYAELGPVHRGRSLHGDWEATDLMVPCPRGVVVALTPWNDPVAIACGLIGAALVTGNTVIHKPSERCPRTGALLGRILADALEADGALEAANVLDADGVLQTVTGDGEVGAMLAAHGGVDVIAHVGSTATGRRIALAAARTGAKVLLENGGNDPLIVDRDVDPAWAAEQAAIGAFTNAGQLCTSVERIYVHREVALPFLDALVAQASTINIGPLVDRRQRDHVHEHVAQALAAGATALIGGAKPENTYYPPTVLTGCTPDMRIMREETFGPVAPVRVVHDFDRALAEACEGEYGLAATVLTASMTNAQRAWRELPVGTVKINAVFGGAPGGAAQPRGASGTGYGYGPELLDELTTTKVVHLGVPR
jgi:betaine-aldehyde dehydrogenase